ncbi:hypothetical protein QBC43DRAFT_48476 [Cladorrhinum sp. PSN259]|nr:hypothetical protein QBC43DRAFT_48476 [Cladorrhinum sp. PSN259]
MAFKGRSIGLCAKTVSFGQLRSSPFALIVASIRSYYGLGYDNRKPAKQSIAKLSQPSYLFKQLDASSKTHHLVVLRHFSHNEMSQLSIAIPVKLGVTFHEKNADMALESMILTQPGDQIFLISIAEELEWAMRAETSARQNPARELDCGRCCDLVWKYISHLGVIDPERIPEPIFPFLDTKCIKWASHAIIIAPGPVRRIRTLKLDDREASSALVYNKTPNFHLINGVVVWLAVVEGEERMFLERPSA